MRRAIELTANEICDILWNPLSDKNYSIKSAADIIADILKPCPSLHISEIATKLKIYYEENHYDIDKGCNFQNIVSSTLSANNKKKSTKPYYFMSAGDGGDGNWKVVFK